MEDFVVEYKLSQYKELTKLNENNKSQIFLVQHMQSGNIYVKKILTNYNIFVYKEVQKIDNIYTPYIYEILEVDGRLIIIEEFINGSTLDEILNKEKILSEEKTIEYMLCLCNIMKDLHSLNPPIIHRDIKPSNIIINNDGILKLIDYDVSRNYKKAENCDTIIMGTQEYASPEQFGFSQTDCRSDIYSMGILMNVLTTGNYPKYKKNNGILEDVIKKCIMISAEERYQSIIDLDNDIRKKLEKIKNDNIWNKNIKTKENTTFKNFYKLIPGFRGNGRFKKIIASFWYGFLILALILPSENSFLVDLLVFIVLLLLTALYTNFLNMNNNMPLLKKDRKSIKFFGYILYTIFLLFVTGSILNYIN
ncbi:protein kinase domain-containing protein [Clostridium rectalis]|uniref:protein kinase domain-containing protein n=1 Tax=Clostridium rectalis TaxID=2040295 RepID=UPI000F62F894|nr:protein kinase [Clostridium rectalis]